MHTEESGTNQLWIGRAGHGSPAMRLSSSPVGKYLRKSRVVGSVALNLEPTQVCYCKVIIRIGTTAKWIEFSGNFSKEVYAVGTSYSTYGVVV